MGAPGKALLRLKLNGKVLQEIFLEEGKTYLSGRKEDCDIPLLQDKSISREHFRLSHQQGQWVVDVISRFGEVIFQGEKVQSLILDQTSVFRVSPYEFEFTLEAGSAAKSSSITEEGSEGGALSERTLVGRVEYIPFIKFVNSVDGEKSQEQLFRLEGGEVWLAGREESCSIPISDQRVSRRQFEIRKLDKGYGIIDLGSVNGTLLNGNNISSTEVTPLRSGDAISVLNKIFYFELHDPQFVKRLQTVDYNLLQRTQIEQESNNQYPLADPAVYGTGYSTGHEAGDGVQSNSPVTAQGPVGGFPYELNPAKTSQAEFFEKIKRKKIQILIGLLALAAFYGFFFQEQLVSSSKPTDLKSQLNDPFNRLKNEQKILIKQSFQLAQSYYDTENAELCRNEISKIKEIMPDYKKSYWAKDIDQLDQSAEQKIYLIKKNLEIATREKQLAEQESKMQEIVSHCKSKLNSKTTREEFDACVSPSVTINPEHPSLVELRSQFAQIEAENLQKLQINKENQEQADRLRRLYSQAEKLEKNGSLSEAIEAYRKVTQAQLFDPQGLKSRAQKNLSLLKSSVSRKTAALIEDADKLAQGKSYKSAILSLRSALKVSPQATELSDKIEVYVKALRKDMKALWDEAIIEENFGKVMPDENNTGAVGKWKKIIELDVPEGEFYQKATVKLKKYGAN